MSNEDVWKDAFTAKNGTPFKRYVELPEGDPVKLQLKPENISSVIIGDFRYVFRMHDGGALVFKNPIKSNDNNARRLANHQDNIRHQQQQSQVTLSSQHVEWLEEAATNSRLTFEVIQRIEKFLMDFESGK